MISSTFQKTFQFFFSHLFLAFFQYIEFYWNKVTSCNTNILIPRCKLKRKSRKKKINIWCFCFFFDFHWCSLTSKWSLAPKISLLPFMQIVSVLKISVLDWC
jgi:hypothetical protein